jgi:nucleotide-binding universal stress UspA family protein
MYKHILLPFDASEPSLKAEKECIAFAKSIKAKVSAIHVISHYHLRVRSNAALKPLLTKIEKEHEEDAKQIAQEMVSALAKRAKADGVECEGLVVAGDQPYEEIINHAEKHKCDLIIMASHGYKGLNAVLLGSETVKVLTHSKIPVLVVR